MAIETLRPNASGSAGWTIQGGAATRHGAVSDDSDTTYLLASQNTASYMDFGTYALGADERVKRVRATIRARAANGSPDIRWFHAWAGFSTGWNDVANISGTLTTYTGAWSTDLLEVASQQPVVDSLQMIYQNPDYSGALLRAAIYEMYLEVDVWQAADAVDVVTPSGTITDTDTPSVSFVADAGAGYSHGDGSPDKWHRQIRVFRASVYTAPGFDPAGDDYEWEYDAPSTSISPGFGGGGGNYPTTPLENNVTYRAYIRYGKNDVAGETLWSPWDYSEFTLDLALPTAPAIDVTADTPNARQVIDVTPAALTYDTLDALRVERSDDGGATWATIRGAYLTSGLAASAQVTLYDYDAPRGVALRYRARVTETVTASGNSISSVWAQDTVTHTNDGQPYLVTVPSPGWLATDSVEFSGPIHIHLGQGLQAARPQNLGVFRPLGSSKHVVVHDSAQLPTDASLAIETFNDPDVHEALGYPGTFLIKLRDGRQYYWHAVGRSYSDNASLWSENTATLWSLELVEVDAAIGEDG